MTAASRTAPMGEEFFRIEGLTKLYPVLRRGLFRTREAGVIRAVDDISFSIRRGETLGLVGESGCGKTTTARTILHLIEPTSGSVHFDDIDILRVFREGRREEELAVRRGIQYVFQDPYLSLNPRWSVAQTIYEPFRVHGHVPRDQWENRLMELLDLVGLEEYHAWRYPHELSGPAVSAKGSASPAPWPSSRASSSATSRSPRSTSQCGRKSSTCWRSCRKALA